MPLKPKLKSNKLISRPPIVSILGHVDHGKTSLLDAIRLSNVAGKEFGGITQHIGAYQIDYKGEKITFIDTPGHAAFAKMRSSGVLATDMVVLVIAADDGVQPQTKESLEHIRKANTPFLIAINKVDLAQSSVQMVKTQLAENQVFVEGYGGDIVCVEVSAKEKKGISDLLEMILLLGKMMDLKANPRGLLEGVVIDSKLDFQRGPVATVLIKNGTLKVKDQIFADKIRGKVKLMLNDKLQPILSAGPSLPVQILGFEQVPNVGSKVSQLKSAIDKWPAVKNSSADKSEAATEEKLKIILKADTLGMLEAIKTNLPSEVNIILASVGQVNESDISLAKSTKAGIITFNVKTSPSVAKLAQIDKITIKNYHLIYELFKDLEDNVLKILEPTINEEILGEAEIIAQFKIKGKQIAGCKIKKGKISKNYPIHLKRQSNIIGDAKIISFQKEKMEVTEAKAGHEIGLVFSPKLDFKLGDVIISYKI